MADVSYRVFTGSTAGDRIEGTADGDLELGAPGADTLIGGYDNDLLQGDDRIADLSFADGDRALLLDGVSVRSIGMTSSGDTTVALSNGGSVTLADVRLAPQLTRHSGARHSNG